MRFRTLGFAVSHPFAKKNAKGWGTEMVHKQAVRDLVELKISAARGRGCDRRALSAGQRKDHDHRCGKKIGKTAVGKRGPAE